ncbi:MAG TPA: undecaprenyl-diphosphate phosphatase [Clostridia bacterium]|nr:MAG: Undecaprenyl-diphosphatase [Firmicutes bacterium ADurb.Bin146]HOD92625.1 undecaprenyl-diphosphate phosphatase [Clostridia bacterium]HQM39461.1 undecaprenyl-diphosphate phosphatase [Clostridia bacterium]
MSIWEAILLGIIQGLTEFLPVSSSGHLVLFEKILNIDTPTLAFNVAVHFATLVAVCVVFWKDILTLLKKPIQKLTLWLIIATIPAGIAGVLFSDIFEGFNDSGVTLGIGFLITAIFLLISSKLKPGTIEKENMKWYDALFIGIMQMVAILPGISRSGSTLTGGLFRKIKKEDAVKFAFLLSIPVILGGFILETYDAAKAGFANIDILPILIGMIFAGISGFFAIKIFVKTVLKGKIQYFAYYVTVLGVFCILDQFVFHIVL